MSWDDIWKTIAVVLTSLGGAAAILIALVKFLGDFWAKKMLAAHRHAFEERLQSLQDQIDRGQFVHKLQFETEFKAYVELWKNAVEIKNTALDLNPWVEVFNDEEDKKAKRKIRLASFVVAYKAFEKYYSEWTPFLAPVVFDAAEKLRNSTHEELRLFKTPDMVKVSESQIDQEEYLRKINSSVKSIVEAADALRDSIRKRIWVSKE